MIGAALPWLALAVAVFVLALELRFIRGGDGLEKVGARRRVPESLDRCRTVALRWLAAPGNPLGTRVTERDEGSRVAFSWGAGGRRRGSLEAAAHGESTELLVELDLGSLHRLTRRLGLLLWTVVGVPTAVGLPLLTLWLEQRTGRAILQPLWFLLLLYWPLHPIILARLESRSTALIAETFLTNLPLLAASDPDR